MGAFGGGQSPSFNAPLITTLVPNSSGGDSTPTYTRATTAYVKDFEDVWRQVPSGAARFEGARVVRNRVSTKSEDFSHASWAVVGTCSKVGNTTITGPAGTSITAMEVAFGANPDSFIYNSMTSVGAAGTVTASVWVRAVSGSTTIRMSASNVLTSAITVDTTWKRISATETGVGTTFAAAYNNAAGNSGNVYLYAAQNEDVTGQSNQNPSEYVSLGVLSAPYHGAGVDGVKYFDTENGNTVASNVVTEATGAVIADATLKGYLAEGSKQNRCLYSQDFSNAAWVATNVNKTADGHTAPDGSATAYALTASAGNGTVIQDLGVVASATKTFTIYLKRKTGTGNIQLTLDGGSTWTTVAITSSWDRYGISQDSLANEDCGIRIVTSGDAVYAWGAQVINGGGGPSMPDRTSYVPTTSAAVTRNTDVLSYPLAGNASNTSGTLYAEVTAPQAYSTVTDNRIFAGSGALILTNGNVASIHDGATTTSTANAATDFAAAKLASAYSGSTTSVVLNGGTVVNGTFDGSVNFTTLDIGGGNGWILVKNLKAWTRRLSDSTIKNMTT